MSRVNEEVWWYMCAWVAIAGFARCELGSYEACIPFVVHSIFLVWAQQCPRMPFDRVETSHRCNCSYPASCPALVIAMNTCGRKMYTHGRNRHTRLPLSCRTRMCPSPPIFSGHIADGAPANARHRHHRSMTARISSQNISRPSRVQKTVCFCSFRSIFLLSGR